MGGTVVLRWDDLAAMSLRVVSGYEGDYISSCALIDHTGRTVVLAEARFGDAADVITATADKLLAPRRAGIAATSDPPVPQGIAGYQDMRDGKNIRGVW